LILNSRMVHYSNIFKAWVGDRTEAIEPLLPYPFTAHCTIQGKDAIQT
jgi:hypothetical protein